MGVADGITVDDDGASVGVVVAVGSITVYVGDGIIVCVEDCVGSRVTIGDEVSDAGLQAARNSTRQTKAREIFTR